MLTQHLGSPDAEAWANYLRGNIVLKITFGFRIILRDGTSIRGIDHDSPKTLNIGDGAGSTLFPMNNGFAVRSSLERSISMEPDIMDLSGFINDSIGVMKDDLRLGKYRDSDLYIFMFRWDDLTFPVIPITRGRIGDVEFEARVTPARPPRGTAASPARLRSGSPTPLTPTTREETAPGALSCERMVVDLLPVRPTSRSSGSRSLRMAEARPVPRSLDGIRLPSGL
jgi:hypothetical protein